MESEAATSLATAPDSTSAKRRQPDQRELPVDLRPRITRSASLANLIPIPRNATYIWPLARDAKNLKEVDEMLKSIQQLPRSAQNHPFTQLCHRCRYLPADARAKVLLLLARRAVKVGAEPQAIRVMMRNFIEQDANAARVARIDRRVAECLEAQTALELLADLIQFMNIAEQYEPLSMLARSVFYFDEVEQQERFDGILKAWEHMFNLMPKAMQDARYPMLPLEKGLALVTPFVTVAFEEAARERINVMNAACWAPLVGRRDVSAFT
jgi:hypothetical protein